MPGARPLPDVRRLLARPIDPAAFSPYGDVVTGKGRTGMPINAGTSLRIDLPEPDVLGSDGRPALAVFRARTARLPLTIRELERHRLGSQTFLPLGATPFVVVVALGRHAPDPDTLTAWRIDGTAGVTFHRDTWHHPLLALADGDFAVLERRGPEPDCELAGLGSATCVLHAS